MPCEDEKYKNRLFYLVPLPWGRGSGTRCNNGNTAKSEMNVSVILTELDSSSQMKRSNCVIKETVPATRENNPIYKIKI